VKEATIIMNLSLKLIKLDVTNGFRVKHKNCTLEEFLDKIGYIFQRITLFDWLVRSMKGAKKRNKAGL
jgi:hypothetical protein